MRVAGHCFILPETTQNFAKNANIRRKCFFFFFFFLGGGGGLVLALVKAWVLSAMVKQCPSTLTHNLQFTPSATTQYLH